MPDRYPTRHPYEGWLNGEVRVLQRGSDFSSRINTMVGLLRHAAALRQLQLRVGGDHANQTLTVQAVQPRVETLDLDDRATRILNQEIDAPKW